MKRSLKVKISDEEFAHYSDVVPIAESREGIARFPVLASDSIIDHWRAQFPDAAYIDLPNAGHYIQEDAPDEIVEAIRAAFG